MENRIWVIRGVANEPVTPGIAFAQEYISVHFPLASDLQSSVARRWRRDAGKGLGRHVADIFVVRAHGNECIDIVSLVLHAQWKRFLSWRVSVIFRLPISHHN